MFFFVKAKTITLPSLCNCVFTDLWKTFYPESFILNASLNLVWYPNCSPAYKCISNTWEQLPFVKFPLNTVWFHRKHLLSKQQACWVTGCSLVGFLPFGGDPVLCAVCKKQCYHVTGVRWWLEMVVGLPSASSHLSTATLHLLWLPQSWASSWETFITSPLQEH